MLTSGSVRVGAVLSALLVVFLSTAQPAAAAEDYVWLEAEEFESTNLTEDDYWTGSDRAHLLSGEKWLSARLKGKAAQNVPAGGYVLEYEMDVPQSGTYDAWLRIGMEWVRAPFEWRIGDGPWHEVPADEATTNVMELARYNEIAWFDGGQVRLDRGRSKLTVRYTETQPDRNDLFIALDCFAFVPSAVNWLPEGDLKPGQRYDDEIDRRARRQVYSLPEAEAAGRRSDVELTGPWQVARWDDLKMDEDPWEPETELPDLDRLHWRGIDVPESQWQVDGLNLAHRTVYRTKVDVPEGYAGRGFKLHFSGTNWLVGVFVNGELAGTHKGVWVPWDMDISGHLKAGQVNEIALAVKGPWYAMDYKNWRGGTTLTSQRNRPLGNTRGVFWVAPIYPSVKGDGDGRQYGIVNPVKLVAVGDAYTEDVFVQPRGVYGRSERLMLDLTVRNTDDTERTFTVQCEAVNDKTDQVERELDPFKVTVHPHRTVTKKIEHRGWRDAKLWWPEPDADLYRLRTTISEDGKPLDVHEQLFGYRWITIEGRGMHLNGKRFNTWNWVGVGGRPQTPEEWVKRWREQKNRFIRFSGGLNGIWGNREKYLEYFDRQGVPGRLCSMIDGMFISYDLGDKVTNRTTGERFIEPNRPVWESWKRHLRQLAKAYRNHPSVLVYQVENELVYINGMNKGYPLDSMEELMGEVVQAGRNNDPTRPYTVGGAGDLDCHCEINAPHYPRGKMDWYPENAYTLEKIKDKLEMYPPFYHNKPWTVGESMFANHLSFATVAVGDEAFRSATNAARGKARLLRDMYEGYRYGGAAGFYPWDNLSRFEDGVKMFSALAAIPRKRTYRLYGGRENRLLFKVMNDTLKDEPVLFRWSYEAGGEIVAEGRDQTRIDCGHGKEYYLTINAPATEERLEGTLTLTVSQPGVDSTEDYVDKRSIPVLPSVESLDVEQPVYALDPSGAVADFLKAAGQEYETIEAISEIDGKMGLLIAGPNALTADQAYGSDILKFAAQGGRAVVLEQEHPVAGANLPAPLKTTTHYGGYSHPQALGTPVFKDLGEDDLIDWSGDHPTYVNPYQKPTQGGRSLVECGEWLERTPMVEMPAGDGVIVLCQMRVGAKLGTDPAADVLLRNMAEHYGDYRPSTGVVAIHAPEDELLLESIKETGVRTTTVDSPLAGLDPAQFQVAIVHATEDNLKALTRARDRVRTFQERGGWLMLCGLGREGIQEYNDLLGTQHQIRPFRMERITLEAPTHPLIATLGNRDLAMYSPKHLQHSLDWISWNVYNAVVDAHENVAPFTIPPGASEDNWWNYEQRWNDKDPFNYVNNLNDHWRYIRQIWVDDEQDTWPFTFEFRRPETIREIRIWNNTNYGSIKDVSILFDGDEASAVKIVLPDSEDRNDIVLETPRRVEKTITLRVESYRESPRRDFEGGYLVGIDNVQFLRTEESIPDEPICVDSIGGLVIYERGRGGFVLNQIKFMEDEPRPVNADKKLNIMGTMLRNMGAGSGAGVVPVAGLNVRYETVSLLDHCNQYLSNRQEGPGWFGKGEHDMSLLPTGERRLQDNVLYHITDYDTAPVPNCIVLGTREGPKGLSLKVEGIDVGKKADLLFFLHTAHVWKPVTPEQRASMKDKKRPFELPEVMRYVVHYADGEKVDIPVILEKHINHWLRADPKAQPGAQVAATVRVPGLEGMDRGPLESLLYGRNARRMEHPGLKPEDVRGVLYGMQVTNPRPDVEIESIDVVAPSRKGRAVPAVLAITLGNIAE